MGLQETFYRRHFTGGELYVTTESLKRIRDKKNIITSENGREKKEDLNHKMKQNRNKNYTLSS